MSYSPLSGYGNSYDSSPHLNAHPAYGSSRQPGSNSYGQQYQTDSRQPPYESSAYTWQGPSQQTYGPTPTQPYANDSWRDAGGQGAQYDYGREASSSATQAATGNTVQNYQGSGSSHTPGQSLQGLNNLAYASGLDSRRHASSRADPSSSQYWTTPNPTINRVQSPVQDSPQPQHWNAHPPTHGGHDGSSSSTATPPLAISAAEALAGAVSRKRQQSSGNPQKTTMPTSASIIAIRRSNSPHTASQNSQTHGSGPSTQSQVSYGQQSSNRATSPNENHSRVSSQHSASQQNIHNQTQRSAASQSNSISNLASTTQEPAQPSTVAAQSVPTYIDPRQIFNPYHKEHERRRKEAAEAESRRKRTEEEVAAAKVQDQQKPEDNEVQKTAKKTTLPDQNTSNPPPKATSPEEDAMAADLKLMMEKLKEFRSRDPGLFQKLWEDMRKGGSGNTNAAANVVTTAASTSPQSSQQNVPAQTNQSSSSAAPNPKPQTPKSKPPSTTPQLPLGAQANGYRVVVEDNKEGLLDLGRFPAERHIRAPRKPTPAQDLSTSPAPVPYQPLPAKTAPGAVQWPKDKRDTLASAAVEALNSNPENKAIGITTADIHAMLEQNISYIELCDRLEKKGLKFHRVHFARQLLDSVPYLTKPPKAINESKPTPPTSTAPTFPRPSIPAQQHPSPPLSQPAPPMPHMDPNGYPPLQMPPSGFVTHPFPAPGPYSTAQYPSMPQSVKSEHRVFLEQKPPKPKKAGMAPTRPEPPPGSKEVMARKRDFSELVDLTQLSDNDDYVLSCKHPRVQSPSPQPDPFEAYQLQQSLKANTVAPSLFAWNSIGLPDGAPLRFDPSQPPRAAAPAAPSLRPKTILAQSVNKGKALRKSYYDPKTVARDILIAAGRHPTERPLNAHMAGMLGVHIDLDSDLSTFDWDAIDPGGPPAPKVEYVDIPAGRPRFKQRKHVHRPSPRPRGEDLRLPDLAKREAAQPAPAPAPHSAKFNAVTRTKDEQLSSQSLSKPSKLRQTHAVDDEASPARTVTPQKRKLIVDSSPAARPPRSNSSQSRPSMDADASGSGAFYPSGKRRGRPPGSKNKHQSLTAMRKTAHVPQPYIEIPARPASPKGNPIFKCRWKGCHAELHNLDTLRKHVAKVHHPTEAEIEDHDYVCWWRKCRFQEEDEQKRIVVTHAFDTQEEWMGHVNEDHLHKLAMKLGDGPNTTQIGKPTSLPDLSRFRFSPNLQDDARTLSYTDAQSLAQDKARYLSDSHGKTTTPSISMRGNKDLPQDTLVLAKTTGENAVSDAAAQKSFLKAHRQEKISMKMNAEETLRAMEKRKQQIGPGIDRGGCTLVNEARRSTFVQNPGIRRVVDADY